MDDEGLRPMLLHAVMATHLPDGKNVGEAPGLLSSAVASIRQHHLLWESSSAPMASALKAKHNLDASRAANDAWMEKVFSLLSSTVAENKWAGLCLLGVTCQECTRQRFLECYNSWFIKLLPFLKQHTDPVFVRAAACASLTDLIVRLGGLIEVAGARRNGANLISKLIQPLLHLIGDKDSSAVLNEAMDLLIAVLRSFPASLRQQSINVEALLVARLMDVNCQSSVYQKCAKALAFLPKAHGDAASWSSLMRRVLIAINADLDFAFRGMEDAAAAEGATRALLPQGQDPPRPLGGQAVSANTGIQPGKSLWRQLLPRISFLLQCCNYLLISPYPTPVPAPVGPLLALVMRILRVDGFRSSSALGTTMLSSQQISLCSELPALHLSALELLAATLRGVRSQLLPRGAALVRLLTDHFRRSGGGFPSLRIKLYAISRHLFIAMGAGMASALAPAVVGSALVDLKGSSSKENLSSSNVIHGSRLSNVMKTSGVGSGSQGINPRKRKEAGGLPGDHSINGVTEAGNNEGEGRAPPAVQVAALQSLEALLNTGGALLPERWRAEVDAVLASVAIGVAADTTSFNLSFDEDSSFSRSLSAKSMSVDFQVASYQALLASLLAPCGHRPPYLAQGLALFRNGRKEVGTEVATVCARALMALEPLIHPRCLPPANAFTMNGSASESGHLGSMPSGGNEYGMFGRSAMKIGHLLMDPWAEVDTWLGYGEATSDDDDDVIPHPESNDALLNGATNGSLGSLAAERVTSGNGDASWSLGGLAGEKVTSANGGEAHVTPASGPSRDELAEDPMQIETQTAAPNDITSRLDDSLTKQGVGVQKPSATHTAEPTSQEEELQNSQPVPTECVLVTTSTDIVNSTSENTLIKGSTTSQGKQVSISVRESETVLKKSVEVTTTTGSAAADKLSFPRVVYEIVSESDSDGPLPAIIDGDPDPDSD